MIKKKEPINATVSIRLTASHKRKLEYLAEISDNSIGEVIRQLIDEEYNRQNAQNN